MFGEPINLTYKGESKYTTHLGGIISLYIVSLLLLFSFFNLYWVAAQIGVSSNTDNQIIDLK